MILRELFENILLEVNPKKSEYKVDYSDMLMGFESEIIFPGEMFRELSDMKPIDKLSWHEFEMVFFYDEAKIQEIEPDVKEYLRTLGLDNEHLGEYEWSKFIKNLGGRDKFIEQYQLKSKYGAFLKKKEKQYIFIPLETGSIDSYYEIGKLLKKQLNINIKIHEYYHQTEKKMDTWYLEPDESIHVDNPDKLFPDQPVEVVSNPMLIDESVSKLKEFFDFANGHKAYTNSTTGFHINLSISSGKIDPLKLMVFYDDRYVAKLFDRVDSHYSPKFQKSAILNLLSKNEDTRIIDDFLKELSNSFYDEFKNIHSLAFSMEKLDKGIVEFRQIGNAGYNEKFDQIKKEILKYASLIKIASDPEARKKEYLQRIFRLLSKNTDYVNKDTNFPSYMELLKPLTLNDKSLAFAFKDYFVDKSNKNLLNIFSKLVNHDTLSAQVKRGIMHFIKSENIKLNTLVSLLPDSKDKILSFFGKNNFS